MDEFLREIEAHRDQFHRYLYRTLWDSSQVEDVFSAAVLTAYQNRHRYTPGTNFRAWMFRILTNKCYTANRETMRTPASLEEKELDVAAPAEGRDYGNLCEDCGDLLQDCGDEIFIAFRQLSTSERMCILLRSIERFSYQEIADILDIPLGTVMTHLARGRAKLRKKLHRYAVERGIVRTNLRIVDKNDRLDNTAEG